MESKETAHTGPNSPTTADTEVSTEVTHLDGIQGILKFKNKLEILLKENALLRGHLDSLKKARTGAPNSLGAQVIVRIKEKVRHKITGYIAEITALKGEREVLLKELQTSHLRIQNAYRQLKELEQSHSAAAMGTIDASKQRLVQLANEYKDTIHKMDAHYTRQAGEATGVIKQYQTKFEGLRKLLSAKDEIIEALTRTTYEQLEAQPAESFEQSYGLLLKAYGLLSVQYESVNKDMLRYKQLFDKGEASQQSKSLFYHCIDTKDKELGTLRRRVTRLQTDNAAKDKVIRACLKHRIEDDESIDQSKRVKIVVYNPDEDDNTSTERPYTENHVD